MGKQNNKWIQNAVKKPGSFDAYCKRQGKNGATAACISKGLHSKNATTKKRAKLAKTLEGFNKKK
jgi:hypothetical protein